MRRVISIITAVVIIALLLPIVSVAECSHPSWYVTTTYDLTGYYYRDEEVHSIGCLITQKCALCGKILEQYGDGGDSERHTFNSAGRCTRCGYNRVSGEVVRDHFNQENDDRQKRAVQAGADAVGHIGTIIKNGNVRSLPDKDSRKVGSVRMNQTYEILDCQQVDVNRMWYLIQLWDGSYGWVSAMLVEVYDVFNYGY